MTVDLYNPNASATQSFDHQYKAIGRRKAFQESLSGMEDSASNLPKQKAPAWPMLAGPVEKDEDELAFEALGAQIAVAAENYKTCVPAAEDVARYGEPADDFEIAWCKQFANTDSHVDDGSH